MKIVGLTCTNGRFSYLRRLLACFLAQDYGNKALLLYNNAPHPITLSPLLSNVKLINNNIDYLTGEPYKDVGSIYRDAITHIDANTDFVSIMDDDDIFLLKHFSRAISSLHENPRFKVWRPGYYFYKYGIYDVEYLPTNNNLEGSCVIRWDFLKEYGFEINTSLNYNLKWLHESIKQNLFFQETDCRPTFCCEYGQTDVIHISSFSQSNPYLNRIDIEKEITSFGDFGIGQTLEPWDKSSLDYFYRIYFDLDNFIEIDS